MADTDVRLDSALFVVEGEDTVVPTAFARGPWSLGLLHGGPVAALLAHSVEQLASDDPARILLFDTPPLLAASEARVLAAHMGQVVLVVQADNTPQGAVSEALATVENCPVVLTLLNKASAGDSGNYYGSYGA